MIGDHQRDSHSAARGITRSPYSASRPSLAPYQKGRSQPAASKKTAPSSRWRMLIGLRRTSRFEAHCSIGWTMPYVLLKPSALRASMWAATRWWS